MKEIPYYQVDIDDPFWSNKRTLNAKEAIFHQYKQLEDTRAIDNFRIITENKNTFREGFFFSDSDVYKWLDAACKILSETKDEKLEKIVVDLGNLIKNAQCDDGYINTYNQIHFPQKRWVNLQIEHELYSLGHLFEAAVSWHDYFSKIQNGKGEDESGHRNARKGLLVNVAEKAAERVYQDFDGKGVKYTPGHQEIELALFKLYQITENERFLNLSWQFLKKRGKISFFFFHLLKNGFSTGFRLLKTKIRRQKFFKAHPELVEEDFKMPENVEAQTNLKTWIRFLNIITTGKEFQQHKPIKDQKKPEGHSVRFTYQQTALAMHMQENPKPDYIEAMEKCWDDMVQKRMFISGGVGQYPVVEGFGHDYELDPEIAYCETCAALGTMFWNWEMAKMTQKAKYSDLLEWQLYNASLVSMSDDGKSYFYKNPLATKKPYRRQKWFLVPCCPSNISRTWASLGKYIFSYEEKASQRNKNNGIKENHIFIHQYIGCATQIKFNSGTIKLKLKSKFPWRGEAELSLTSNSSSEQNLVLHFRIPSWSSSPSIKVHENDQEKEVELKNKGVGKENQTASGINPYKANYETIQLNQTKSEDHHHIQLEFPMEIKIRKMHPKTGLNKVSLTRGPLLYCCEDIDNQNQDIFTQKIKKKTLHTISNIELGLFGENNIYENMILIKGKTSDQKDFTAIPYFCWGNRGPSLLNTKFLMQ